MRKSMTCRDRTAVRQRLFHWVQSSLAASLTILIAGHAVAGERKPGNASHILCLRPDASVNRPGRKAADAATLACLLSAAGPEKTVSWQREFRCCLSDQGVILAADCHY